MTEFKMSPLQILTVSVALLTIRHCTAESTGNVTSGISNCGTINERTQRERIQVIAEQELSSPECKATIQPHATDQTITLQDVCRILESMKSMIMVNCTESDYGKLHEAICIFSTCSSPDCSHFDERKQREQIQSIISNELSSPDCKAAIQPQAADNTVSLQKACEELEKFKGALSMVNCTQGDYDKLHEAICPFSTCHIEIMNTTTNPPNCTNVNEKEIREKAQLIIDQIPAPQCKAILQSQIDDKTLTVQEACSLLETYKGMISIVNCTQGDYDKLHEAICPFSTCHIESMNTTTNPPNCTNFSENEIREKAQLIIDQIPAPQCKAVLQSQLDDKTITVQEACSLLETYKGMISRVNCTGDDYDKLHEVICQFSPCHIENMETTTSSLDCSEFNEREQRERIQFIVKNELSSPECTAAFQPQIANGTVTLQDACRLLDSYRTMMSTYNCTQADYRTLQEAFCAYSTCPIKADETSTVTTVGNVAGVTKRQSADDMTKPCCGGEIGAFVCLTLFFVSLLQHLT